MKRRPINKDKYGISKHRYLEVIHHCLQYPEWREELENMTDTVKAIQYGQEGKGSPSQASATECLAIKRAELQEKCERIEQTAIEADADIYQCLFTTYNLKPEECVFLDDRPENIEGGEKLGMRGIVFESYEDAKAKLEKML